jgi:hypothetical protein
VVQEAYDRANTQRVEPGEPLIRPRERRVERPRSSDPLPEDRVTNGRYAEFRKSCEIIGPCFVPGPDYLVEVPVMHPIDGTFDPAPDLHYVAGACTAAGLVTELTNPLYGGRARLRAAPADNARDIRACIRAQVRSHDCIAR